MINRVHRLVRKTLVKSQQIQARTSPSVLNSLLGPRYELSTEHALHIMVPALRRGLRAHLFKAQCEMGRKLVEMGVQSHIFKTSQSFDELRPPGVEAFVTQDAVHNWSIKSGLAGVLVGAVSRQDVEDAVYLLAAAIYMHHGETRGLEFVERRVAGGRGGLIGLSV